MIDRLAQLADIVGPAAPPAAPAASAWPAAAPWALAALLLAAAVALPWALRALRRRAALRRLHALAHAIRGGTAGADVAALTRGLLRDVRLAGLDTGRVTAPRLEILLYAPNPAPGLLPAVLAELLRP